MEQVRLDGPTSWGMQTGMQTLPAPLPALPLVGIHQEEMETTRSPTTQEQELPLASTSAAGMVPQEPLDSASTLQEQSPLAPIPTQTPLEPMDKFSRQTVQERSHGKRLQDQSLQ